MNYQLSWSNSSFKVQHRCSMFISSNSMFKLQHRSSMFKFQHRCSIITSSVLQGSSFIIDVRCSHLRFQLSSSSIDFRLSPLRFQFPTPMFNNTGFPNRFDKIRSVRIMCRHWLGPRRRGRKGESKPADLGVGERVNPSSEGGVGRWPPTRTTGSRRRAPLEGSVDPNGFVYPNSPYPSPNGTGRAYPFSTSENQYLTGLTADAADLD